MGGVSIQGGKELEAVLAGLPGKFGTTVVGRILRKAAKPLVDRAKELSSAHDESGDTTKSIGIITNRKENSITVGPRRGNGFKGYVGHIIEYGAAPHTIKAKAAGGQLRLYGGKLVDSVEHPGIAARPFMRPAFDEKKQVMINSVNDQCNKIIVSEFKTVYKVKK